jgi:hypothetical protein
MRAPVLVAALLLASAPTACVFGQKAPARPERADDIPVKATMPIVGPLKLLGEAFSTIVLTTDQRRQVAIIRDAMERRYAPVIGQRKVLARDLAMQMQVAHIDEKTLEDDGKAIGLVLEPILLDDARDFVRLHDLLTPEQRAAVAKSVREQIAKEGPGGMLDIEARWKVWRTDLHIPEERETAIRDRFRADTELVESIKRERNRRQEIIEKLVAAFETPDFTLESVPRETGDEVIAREMARAKRLARFVACILPDLTPEQATRAAEMVAGAAGIGYRPE